MVEKPSRSRPYAIALALETGETPRMTDKGTRPRNPTSFRPACWLAGAAVLALTQCAPRETLVSYKDPARVAIKNETFGYRKWISPKVEQDIAVIALHGFDGASIDYENLGKNLLKTQPKTALYAYEVRGQGSDPLRSRRGDIENPSEWYQDLEVFTAMVRERHPKAKIVWMGESMGALITAHTWEKEVGNKPPCDAMIFSSPVVKIRDDVPPWKVGLLNVAATAAPLARLSLEELSGGQEVQMTTTSIHSDQAETNAWHVDKHTLRLLSTLGHHISSMNECAETVRVPVLVLHGGRDFFTNDQAIREFTSHFPKDVPVTTKNYNDAYHLLMYDVRKDEVIRDIGTWVNGLRK